MKALFTAAAAVALCGCVHATHFVGPHGEAMVSLRCNGAALDMADCYSRAREECGGNFDVVDQNQHTAYLTQTQMNGAYYSSSTQAVPERNLVVVCQSHGAGALVGSVSPPAAQPPVATPAEVPPAQPATYPAPPPQ